MNVIFTISKSKNRSKITWKQSPVSGVKTGDEIESPTSNACDRNLL